MHIISNLKIVRYSKGGTVYISNNILNKYLHLNCETLSFRKQQQLKNIFTMIPINSSKYMTETIFSRNIIYINDTLNNIAIVAFYTSIIFFVFAILLLMNFINITISNKRNK